jgi:hypothetical protein
MRFFIIVGGSIGFLLALASSFHAGNAPAFALHDGAIGCLVGSFLFQLGHRAYHTSLMSFLNQRAAVIKQTHSTPAEKVSLKS